jgi:hypothetical protein
MLTRTPFPQTTEWISTNLDGGEVERLREYLWAIEYHLTFADLAEQRASAALRSGEWGISQDGSKLYLVRFDPLEIVRFGDIAIRESASSLDAALQFLNGALDMGVAKTKVHWNRTGKGDSLRGRLLAAQIPEFQVVVDAVDAVFGSIASALLHGYRHWVTHRGAPRVRLLHALEDGISIPEEIANEADERLRAHRVETLLITTIPTWIRIECYPFVPQVQSVINLDVDEAEEDIDIPGFIHIGKGAKNITIRDSSIRFGSPMDSVEEFKSKNPIVREEDKIRAAGEDLAVYKAWDYLHALHFATGFVSKALSEEWDRALARAMAAKPLGAEG